MDTLLGVRRTILRGIRGEAESPLLTKTTEPDAVQKEALRRAGVKL